MKNRYKRILFTKKKKLIFKYLTNNYIVKDKVRIMKNRYKRILFIYRKDKVGIMKNKYKRILFIYRYRWLILFLEFNF